MELVPKTNPGGFPIGRPIPIFCLQIEYYADRAEIRGLPKNPVHLLDVVRMLTAEYMRHLQEQQRQAKGGLILTVDPIRNGPANGV